MDQHHQRRQRPAVAVQCVCIAYRTPSIILATLIAAVSLSLMSMLQQPQQWLARDAIHYQHSTIPTVLSLVPLDSISTAAAATNEKEANSTSTDKSATLDFDFKFDPSTSLATVIFYNIYLHPDRTDLGIAIVEEQLAQVAKSYAAQSQSNVNKRQTLTIYYNTVGAANALNPTYMDDLCASHGLDCRHMQHYDTGFEEVTLQRVHDFCTRHTAAAEEEEDNDTSTDMRVVYMHNKGSYHVSSTNNFWRRHLTMAVTSQHCLSPPATPANDTNDTCNVCGLQFWPMWVPFFPGNFWAAKCSYVTKLVPARTFSSATASLHANVTELVKQGKLSNEIFPPDKFPLTPDRYGLDRFAAEHWIGSHPHLVPCDLSKTAGIHYWYMRDVNHTEFNFHMAPRMPLRAPLKLWPFMQDVKKHKLQVLKSPVRRSKEYFLLPGYIFKWYALYREFPPASSWVWSWFPDGDLWKDRVAKHGTKLIDWMLTTTTTTGLARTHDE